jgi:hypothetical protein
MVDLIDLERRVAALEAANNEHVKTLNWVVGTLGRVAADVSSVKEDTKALRENMASMDRRLTDDIAALRRDLPGMLTEAVREGLKGH